MNADRTRGRRKLDSQIHSYLVDVEQSLLQATVQTSQLEEALESRTTIGQAIGLLMAHEGLRPDEAFQKLVRVSQNANIKLRDIAARYLDAWEEKINARDG